MSKTKKIILWIVGIIVAVLAFLWFLGTYGYQIQNYYIQKSQEKYLAQVEENRARLLEAQKNDTFGGKTPEETLDLYIAALKAGDIELASKYYVVSVETGDSRIKEKERFEKILGKDGNLDVIIKNVEKIKNLGIKNIWSSDYVSFVYKYLIEEEMSYTSIISKEEIITIVPKGTEMERGEALKLNPYTKVWKIIQ